MLLDRRMKGIPLSFIVILVATIILTIFFGAWAVSADVEAGERSFYFPAATGGANFNVVNDQRVTAEGAPGEEDTTNADTWWGSAFLKACPLH